MAAFTSYRNTRREKARFAHLTESLRSSSDPEYITICLALINAIVNSPEGITCLQRFTDKHPILLFFSEIDERVNLRNEFLRQGLDDILVQVKKTYRLEDEPDLHTQIDVFEDELASDKEELMER